MDKTNKFDLQYFLTDTSFKNWAKGLNKNDIAYWNNWLLNNPQHIETVENAKAIVVGINFKPQFLSNEKVNQELAKILPKIGIENSTKNTFNKNKIIK